VNCTSILRAYASLALRCVLLVIMVCGFSVAAFSQNSAVLHGVVTDPTGAVIPNATVNVTTPDGHTAATVKSDGAGAYHTGNLTPGTYIVLGNAPGFAPFASKAVTLGAGENRGFNLKLPIAEVKQQVQVESEPLGEPGSQRLDGRRRAPVW